jgi:hypothetical protein
MTDKEKRAAGWKRRDEKPITCPANGILFWIEGEDDWYKIVDDPGLWPGCRHVSVSNSSHHFRLADPIGPHPAMDRAVI